MDESRKNRFVTEGRSFLHPVFWIYFIAEVIIGAFNGKWFSGLIIACLLLAPSLLYMKQRLNENYAHSIIASCFALHGLAILWLGNWFIAYHLLFALGGICLLFIPYGRHWWLYSGITIGAELFLYLFDLSTSSSIFAAFGNASSSKMFAGIFILLLCTMVALQAFAYWRGGYEKDILERLTFMKVKTAFVEKNIELARKLSQGALNEDIVPDQADELGQALTEMQKNLSKAQMREEEERFTSIGLTAINDILRTQHESVESLCYEVLFKIIKYVGLNQGGVFIVQEEAASEKEVLELMAYYAYDRQKFLQKRFEIREGLPGQVLFEKETIQLNEVPEDFVTIGSGLGDARPRFVAAVPIKSNEKVVGVMELASFKQLLSHEVDFLEKSCESFASTLIAVKGNEETKKFLQQSQEMTEQLRAQEEEMRQNMEELQATQEEVVRNQQETEARIKAIDQSGIGYVEFDMDSRIINANKTFLDLMNYSIEEVRGQRHSMFLGDSEEEKAEVEALWEGFRKGVTKLGTFKRVTKDGRSIYLNGAYSVVRDMYGDLKGVIKIASDVSKNKKLLQRAQQQAKELKEKKEGMEKINDALNNSKKQIEARMTAIDEAGLLSAEFDLFGNFTRVNKGFENITGYKAEEVIGKHHKIMLVDDFDKWEEYEQLWNNLRNGVYYKAEVERKGKAGGIVVLNASYIPIKDSDGKTVAVLKLAVDVTTTKKLLARSEAHIEEIEEQEQQMRDILEGLQGIQESEHHLKIALAEKEKEITKIQQQYTACSKELTDLKNKLNK